MKKALLATALFAGIFTASTANAFQEYPIGEAVTMNEMEIAAVYLKPIDMDHVVWVYLLRNQIST